MANHLDDGYWEEVRRRWAASIKAGNDSLIDNSAQLRHKRFQRIRIRSYTQIAITGRQGCGKSVIYDAIAGRIGESYRFPPQTEKPDDWLVKTGRDKRRSGVFIIPGQLDSADQEQAFNTMFRNGNYPHGVIHVVNWGYDWIWHEENRRAVVEYLQGTRADLNLETLREENLREEFNYFSTICNLVKDAWQTRPPGVWFIVAITKSDLYWSKMDEVMNYYLPDRDDDDDTTQFRSALSNLVTTLHHGGLRRLAVLPVSSVLTPFDFSASTDFPFQNEIFAAPSMQDTQRQALLSRLQLTIGEFNAKR